MNEPRGMQSSPQHELLLRKVGEWEVECAYFVSPDEEPLRVTGKDRVEAIGEYWTEGHFEVNISGLEVKGRAITGYDPERNCFLGTWCDSSNPYLYLFEGQLHDDGVTLEMEGDNIDPHSRQLVKYRSVEVLGDDERKLSLFLEAKPNQEIQILEYTYRRRS